MIDAVTEQICSMYDSISLDEAKKCYLNSEEASLIP